MTLISSSAPTLTARTRRLVAAALTSLALGCGSDADPTPTGTDPKYLAAIATLTTDSATTYTATVPAIDGTIVQHFLKRGLESDGYGSPSSFDGAVYVPQGADPSIKKFTVNVDGTLTEIDTISFAGEGIAHVGNGPRIGETMIDAEKAYLFDTATLRAVVWDPKRMVLTGDVIDLAEVVKEPVAGAPDYAPALFVEAGFVKQVGDLMFVPVRWQNWSAETPDKIIYPLGGLLVIDTAKDEVVHLLTDERLVDTIYTVVSPSGDLYLFTGAFGASFNLAFGLGTPPGVLKIKKGETTFDPDYYLNLEKLIGRPATTPSGGRDTEVFIKVLYEEEADIYAADGSVKQEIVAEPWQLLNKGWRYWRIDVEKPGVAEVIDELPMGGTDGYFYTIPQEDRLFLAVMQGVKLNFDSMTLYEVVGSGFVESISVPGTLQALARLDRTE
jgi:hypothetical protein